jgi:hypothetical protein
MSPKRVVLHGAPALERAANLMRSMVNAPPNLDEFGRAMVSLMTLHESATLTDEADCIQPFLRQFKLDNAEDPGFDERIMFEALKYCAGRFRQLWEEQVPGFSYRHYQFNRWLGTDLVLERR